MWCLLYGAFLYASGTCQERERQSLGVSESVRGALVGFMLLEAVIKVTQEDMICLASMTHWQILGRPSIAIISVGRVVI